MKEGRKPEYPEKTPNDELQKMPHTKARKFQPQGWVNPHSGIGGRLGKQACWPLHHASPFLCLGGRAVRRPPWELLLFVGCLRSQQHASVSQGWICSDNFTCCLTEIEVADQTFHLTQSQYADTRPSSPSTDPVTPGAWQGSHWSAIF